MEFHLLWNPTDFVGDRPAPHRVANGHRIGRAVRWNPGPLDCDQLAVQRRPAGIRKWLAERGVTYGVVYTSEALGNLSGGIRQGGLLAASSKAVAANLEKRSDGRG